MTNKSRLTLLFTIWMRWRSTGERESADVADGTGKTPREGRHESKLLISLKCNIQIRQGRNQGPTTAKGFRKPKISTTLESAKVFRLYTR